MLNRRALLRRLASLPFLAPLATLFPAAPVYGPPVPLAPTDPVHGRLTLPVAGSSGGLLLGGDILLHSTGTTRWRTHDFGGFDIEDAPC